MQTTTPTRSELLKAVTEVRDAGGSTTHMLHTIARMVAGPAAAPEEFELESVNVFDMAGFHFDCLSSEYELNTGKTPYSADATFDELTGDDQERVIDYVITEFGELDMLAEPPAAPVALADQLLDGLRQAAALKFGSGPHFAATFNAIREALVALLATQSVERGLALESINNALETGKGIVEAVAYMDGQL